MPKKTSYISSITESDRGEVIISASIPWEEVANKRGAAIKELGKNITLPGFRSGHAPQALLEKTIGEYRIIEESAKQSIKDAYAPVLKEVDKNLIGQPNISITKIEPESPLEFTITADKSPEVTIGDYTKIAREVFKKSPKTTVETKEIEDGILHIRQQVARSNKWEEMKKNASEEGLLDDTKSFPAFHEIDISDAELPELNDEFVQNISGMKTVEEFRKSFEDSLKEEKELRTGEEVLNTIVDSIVDASTFFIPESLVENEKHRIRDEFNSSLERQGASFDEVLKKGKTTREDIEKEWHTSALRRVRTQLALMEIALKEKLVANEEEVHHEAHQLMKAHKGVDHDLAMNHVRTIMTNREVIRFLSKLKNHEEKEVKKAPKKKPLDKKSTETDTKKKTSTPKKPAAKKTPKSEAKK